MLNRVVYFVYILVRVKALFKGEVLNVQFATSIFIKNNEMVLLIVSLFCGFIV